MRRVVMLVAIAGAILTLPGPVTADHLDCGRPWPGTPTEANQAWAECKQRDRQEHLLDLQRRELEQKSPPASATAPVCPVVVSVGDVWIDHYPVTVRNVGTGTALGVVISRTRTAASGLGGMTTVNDAVHSFDRLGPGEHASVRVHKSWEGSYTAAASACVPR